jgi:hypothetical protein
MDASIAPHAVIGFMTRFKMTNYQLPIANYQFVASRQLVIGNWQLVICDFAPAFVSFSIAP